jgi:hypothetical protein
MCVSDRREDRSRASISGSSINSVIFNCHCRSPEKRGVIARVFVLPVRAFDVEFSGSKPMQATGAAKSATHGSSARPKDLSA